jgi:hypothetical protein
MPKYRIWIVVFVLALGSLVVLLRQCSGAKSLAVHDLLNSDGVRADVAAEIAKAFPESEKKRAAATQLARAFQIGLDRPDDASDVYAIYEKAKSCLNAVEGLGPNSGPTGTSTKIESWVVNTTARSRAYIHYNAGLSGRMFTGPGENIADCNFDPSKMAN